MKKTVLINFIILFFLWGNNAISNPIPNTDKASVMEEMFTLTGWNRKQPITIQASQVSGTSNLTDFPVLITLNHLNSEIVDAGANSALNGGGDIRFSSDADGNNQLAIEVVEFVTSATPANRKCQIWVKVPSLSTTSNTTIYIWYNKSGEVQPAPSSTYGSQAVWSNYFFVSHDGLTDSAGGLAITQQTTTTETGPFGNQVASYNGSQRDVFDSSSFNGDTGNGKSIMCWANYHSTTGVFQRAIQVVNPTVNIMLVKGENGFTDTFQLGGVSSNNSIQEASQSKSGTYAANTWHFIAGGFLTSKPDIFVNGNVTNADGAFALNGGNTSVSEISLGGRTNNATYFEGGLSTIMIAENQFSNDYFQTQYNNQGSPSSFAIAGTPQNGSSSGGDTQSPTAPTLSSTGHTATTVDLSWNGATDDTGVTGYIVYQDNVVLSNNVTSTTYQVTGLTAATSYDFKVKAYDAASNQSADSNVISVTTDSSSGGGGGSTSSVWTESGSTASYTGGVAIGTSSVPNGYKLAVDGNIRTREIRVDQDTWPDYVFEESYDLPSLEDIKKHIEEKGHLPNIPSAKEVETNGVELGEMNRLLLEKIEELTLYIIQLEFRLNEMESTLEDDPCKTKESCNE